MFLSSDRSKDASYIGKILEGFTLAQNPAEEKTVGESLQMLLCLEVDETPHPPSRCRSSLLPPCPEIIARSIDSVHKSTSPDCLASVRRWLRP